ncbi:MAG: RDD family protein [Candidatus Zixiibacteriota bacterium]
MENMAPPTMQPPTMARPQAVRATWADAERGSRLLAAIIDAAIVFLIYGIAFSINEPMFVPFGIIGLVAYQGYLLTVFGQTIGKKVMNIKIVKIDTDENGGFVTNFLLRFLLNAILGFIPLYGLVDVLFIFRDDRRCIHDMIAGTRVVSEV